MMRGYDLVNDLDGVLNEFDKVIGLDRLKVLHINDSKIHLRVIKIDTLILVKDLLALIR